MYMYGEAALAHRAMSFVERNGWRTLLKPAV
jgi:hypothetical protein